MFTIFFHVPLMIKAHATRCNNRSRGAKHLKQLTQLLAVMMMIITTNLNCIFPFYRNNPGTGLYAQYCAGSKIATMMV